MTRQRSTALSERRRKTSEGSSGPLVDGYLTLVSDEGWVSLVAR